MSSSDPSLVDTSTLLKSMRRDFSKSEEGLQQFFRFFHESQATLFELVRRTEREFKVMYSPHKAGPKPQQIRPGHQRHWICQDCDHIPDCPMLTEEVWYSIAEKSTLLCIYCTEKRLDRQISLEDLRDCPGNAFAFLVHDRLTGGDRAVSVILSPPPTGGDGDTS